MIVVTSDGVTTTATLRQGKTVLREAKAVCGKKDIFDYSFGANLAVTRLLEEPIAEDEYDEMDETELWLRLCIGRICIERDGKTCPIFFANGTCSRTIQEHRQMVIDYLRAEDAANMK